VQGEWSAVDDESWKMESIRFMLRSSSKPSRGSRGGSKKRLGRGPSAVRARVIKRKYAPTGAQTPNCSLFLDWVYFS